MKYFFPILMALGILSGVMLTFTPYLAEWIMPAPAEQYQRSNSDDAKRAIADWFQVPPDQILAAEGIRLRATNGSTAWFSFKANRDAVTQFVRANRLEQRPLDNTVMQERFMAIMPPVDWWQPASLGRETYFANEQNNGSLSLIYNAEQAQGYLLVKTALPKPQSF